MEKLIELLNEYAHTYADHYDTGEEITITFFSHADNCFQYVCDGGYETLIDDVVISKRFSFIKRLVDNDKINTESWPLYWFHFIMSYRQPYSLYETILMLLSISDTPIEDLVSYLK